jgi:hypothetical protein
MTSAYREAERLQQEEPKHFDAIVTEAVVAQPELGERDPLQLVTLYVYGQRVRTYAHAPLRGVGGGDHLADAS